jgi:hypothetical protein
VLVFVLKILALWSGIQILRMKVRGTEVKDGSPLMMVSLCRLPGIMADKNGLNLGMVW